MKTILRLVLVTVVIIAFSGESFSFDDPKLNFGLYKDSKSSLSMKERDFRKAKDLEMERTSRQSIFYIDFHLGYGSTNPKYDVTDNSKNISSTSQGGFTTSAFLTIKMFDLLNFTTGLDFTKKNFGITGPSLIDTTQNVTEDLSNNFLNIPLMFNLGGQLSDNIGINLTAGPYFGFLLGDSDNIEEYGLKNFDFGINAMLTGDYALNQFVSILLGTGMQFGGLNNFGSTNYLSNVSMNNWNVFTGLRLGI